MPVKPSDLKLIFAGTPDFAAQHLKGLCEAGYQVSLVLTQPDARVGRGRKTQPTPVKAYALEQNIPVLQPEKLRGNQDVLEHIRELKPDFMIVVAYGLIIPLEYLEAPVQGCLNVHGSILPRWRGAAPVQRAIEFQDPESGVCIMQMDEGLDTGPVRHQKTIAIEKQTSNQLLDQLAVIGVEALLEVLADPQAFPPVEQSAEGVNYAHKIHKTEKDIDWSKSAAALEAKNRAMQPWPGQAVENSQFSFKVLESDVLSGKHKVLDRGVIDQVSSEGISVACGDGSERYLIKALQLAGGKPMSVKDFLNGKPDFFKTGDDLSRVIVV